MIFNIMNISITATLCFAIAIIVNKCLSVIICQMMSPCHKFCPLVLNDGNVSYKRLHHEVMEVEWQVCTWTYLDMRRGFGQRENSQVFHAYVVRLQ